MEFNFYLAKKKLYNSLVKNCMRDTLKQIVNNITSYDNKEVQDKKETFDWLNTNQSIYRIKKPDTHKNYTRYEKQHIIAT